MWFSIHIGVHKCWLIKGYTFKLYLVHIRELISLFQINTDECTHIITPSGNSFCCHCCRNVSVVLPENGPSWAETCRSDTLLIKWRFNHVCVHSSVFNWNKKYGGKVQDFHAQHWYLNMNCFEEEIREFKSEQNVNYITDYFIYILLYYSKWHIFAMLSYVYFSRLVSDTLQQPSATYGTRAKRGTWNDFQWHAEWIEIQ